MIEAIKIHESEDEVISVLKLIHFCSLDLNQGLCDILPQYKEPLFNLLAGLTQLYYPLQMKKRCPLISLWIRYPVLAPYIDFKFWGDFEFFNDATRLIVQEENLTDPEQYKSIEEKIKDFYKEEYPSAYFDIRIFAKKYHGVKGYFVFIDDKHSLGLFWGYDDPSEEIELEEDLFEED